MTYVMTKVEFAVCRSMDLHAFDMRYSGSDVFVVGGTVLKFKGHSPKIIDGVLVPLSEERA